MSAPPPVPVARGVGLVSIPQLARMKGVPRRTLYDDLMALWARDVTEGGGDWLHRLGARRKVWVNLSRLRVAHPALFEQRFVERCDFDELQGRVDRLEAKNRELNQRANALAASLRDLRAAHRTAAEAPRDGRNGAERGGP